MFSNIGPPECALPCIDPSCMNDFQGEGWAGIVPDCLGSAQEVTVLGNPEAVQKPLPDIVLVCPDSA